MGGVDVRDIPPTCTFGRACGEATFLDSHHHVDGKESGHDTMANGMAAIRFAADGHVASRRLRYDGDETVPLTDTMFWPA